MSDRPRMTKTRNAAEGIGLFLAAVALAWPAVTRAHDTSRLADAGVVIGGYSGAAPPPAAVAPSSTASRPQHANFLGEPASNASRRVADWVVASGDNGDLPFIIIDKIRATVYVFDRAGRLLGAAPALLGKAHGDDTVPGIGSKKLSAIRPDERTTPAGRFVASLGRDLEKKVLWVDYKDALSLHPVIRGAPGDHRFQRLATPSPLDNRISYGCINVPASFFRHVVLKAFTGTSGIVYILPEIKSLEDIFPILQPASRSVKNAAEQSPQSAAAERASLSGSAHGLYRDP